MFWAVAVISLSGCAFLSPKADPTRFYVLTAPASTPARNGEEEFKHWQVRLNRVEMPAYLRTRFMVVRTGTNEIHFEEFERWAEPLDEGIKRVMEETLEANRHLDGQTLNRPVNLAVACEVSIQIFACEGVRDAQGNGSIRLSMAWEARSSGTNSTASKRGGFTTHALTWDGKDYGQLAQRLSEAITAASKRLEADMPIKASIPEKSNTSAIKL